MARSKYLTPEQDGILNAVIKEEHAQRLFEQIPKKEANDMGRRKGHKDSELKAWMKYVIERFKNTHPEPSKKFVNANSHVKEDKLMECWNSVRPQ